VDGMCRVWELLHCHMYSALSTLTFYLYARLRRSCTAGVTDLLGQQSEKTLRKRIKMHHFRRKFHRFFVGRDRVYNNLYPPVTVIHLEANVRAALAVRGALKLQDWTLVDWTTKDWTSTDRIMMNELIVA